MNRCYLDELATRHPELAGSIPEALKACEIMASSYRNGGKVLVCGNGGSSADADHIVGELMKGFLKKRPLSKALEAKFAELGEEEIAKKLQVPLRAINLAAHTALSTALANDVDPNLVYAQAALGYADSGDVFIGISTSGNAKNVHYGAASAKAKGARLIGLTGADGGKMKASGLYDVIIHAPGDVTHHVQEAHIALYHAVCLTVEEEMF